MKTVTLILCVFLFAAVGSAADICLGLHGGLVANLEQDALRIDDYDVNTLTSFGGRIYIADLPFVDLQISGDYSWRNELFDISGNPLNLRIRDLAFTATALYPIATPLGELALGAGIGSHSLTYEYVRAQALSLTANAISIPQNGAALGYHLMASLSYDLPYSRVGFVLEGRYTLIDAPVDNITYLTLRAGLYLHLPQ